ncbi:MAG: hypothetical protein LOX97_08890 [Sphingomonas sp.]|nr:hypothetical protein [Sphingomonas sp.]
MQATYLVPLTIALSACAIVTADGRTSAPPGARIEASGFATILRAPPAPFEPPQVDPVGWEAPLPIGEVRLPGDDVEILQYRWDRGIPIAQARSEIMQLRADGPEARSVEARARAAEPDNFIQLGIQRSPVAAWKFAFKRDPEQSLRRYTSNPRFVAERLPFTLREAEVLWARWWPRLQAYAAFGSKGPEGISLGMKITEEEFRSLAQFRDFDPPSGVRLQFPEEPELPAVTQEARPFVRILPRQRYFPGIILTGSASRTTSSRITLRDGCLYFGDSLLRVNRTMGLFLDAQGYLALRDRADPSLPHVRIGEIVAGGGGYAEPLSEADRTLIASHCGDRPVVDLYQPRSKVNWEKYRQSY